MLAITVALTKKYFLAGYMKNIVLLGTKVKLLPIFNYCHQKNYSTLVIGNPDANHKNDTVKLTSIANKYSKKLFNDFVPSQVINMKEQKDYLQLESHINQIFDLQGNYNNSFFYSKQRQDKIFKELDIPTVPNVSKKVIVKSDFSGGTNFFVTDRKNASGFFQDYLNIDYIVSCHFYGTLDKWYHLNNHIIKYINNCPSQSVTPVKLFGEDKNIIEYSITKLSKKIKIANKLFGWQFLKDKSGNLYSIDFNLRPFGGFDAGSYDTDVSDQIWCSYLFGNTPPNVITYTSKVECIYTKPQQFGYAPWERKKSKNLLKFKVKTYNV